MNDLANNLTSDHPKDKDFGTAIIEGKDELNLAEFPLSSIAYRLDLDQKTMIFEDKIWDANRGEMVTRQLTITASHQYGLPTALDDEVILGLIQISKLRNFADRKVNFSRYQLIRILNWRDESKSYERIEKSLNRWVGVTLYYKNAWWSREHQCWVDEKFHLLENVTLFDRERGHKLPSSIHQESLPLSSFVWNEVILRSFHTGNLKSIDFDFYVRLKSPISKRLYRFLDKRFFHRGTWEFDLKEFSFEHTGLSRNYDTANLKRKLRPAIEELEANGFLRPMQKVDRFRKVNSGEWRVIFSKADVQAQVTVQPSQTKESEAIKQALIDRGVTSTTAVEMLTQYPLERITAQLEIFDWLVEQKNAKVSQNPAGFLISAIKGEYAPPKGFLTREEREKRERELADRKRKLEEKKKEKEDREVALLKAREEVIKHFWDSFSDDERIKMRKQALENATPFDLEIIGKGGQMGKATQQKLLDEFALSILSQG